MLVDCCTPVFALIATTETCEVPVGVVTAGGVLLLLQPSMRALVPRLSRRSGTISEILSRKVSRRRMRSRENGSKEASPSEKVGYRWNGVSSRLPIFCPMPEVSMVICVVETALEATLTVEGEKLHVAPEGRPVQKKVTPPLKPLTGATLTVMGAEELPLVTVVAPVEAVKPKVGVAPVVVALVMAPSRP